MKKNEIKRAGSWWWTGRPGVLQSMGSQRDMTEWLNWTEAEFGASLVAQTVKNLPAVQQTQVCPDWYYSEKVKISEDVNKISLFRYSSVQLLSRVRLFVTPLTAARQASLSNTNSQNLPKLTSIELWCHPAISSSSFSSCPQSLPASGSFPMSQLFAWGGQSTGVSALASVLPKNTQGWSLEWIGWISLQSKGLSRVFSNTTVQKHQFFGAQLSL